MIGKDDPDLLDEPTLRQLIVERTLALRQRGRRGIDQLPPVVAVQVTVAADRSVAAVRAYLDDPAFDDEIGAALANRLVGLGAAVPTRLYAIEGGDRSAVSVREAAAGAWAVLRVEGGDRDGATLSLTGNRPRYHLGRGPWHGEGEAPANDLMVSDGDRFVSRRAAVLRRAGSGLEIAALDQGEYLAIVRADGRRIRPTHARSGRVRLAIGDRIELSDGERQRVVLHVERPAAEAPAPASAIDPIHTATPVAAAAAPETSEDDRPETAALPAEHHGTEPMDDTGGAIADPPGSADDPSRDIPTPEDEPRLADPALTATDPAPSEPMLGPEGAAEGGTR